MATTKAVASQTKRSVRTIERRAQHRQQVSATKVKGIWNIHSWTFGAKGSKRKGKRA